MTEVVEVSYPEHDKFVFHIVLTCPKPVDYINISWVIDDSRHWMLREEKRMIDESI